MCLSDLAPSGHVLVLDAWLVLHELALENYLQVVNGVVAVGELLGDVCDAQRDHDGVRGTLGVDLVAVLVGVGGALCGSCMRY
jgi:hypothetical protein